MPDLTISEMAGRLTRLIVRSRLPSLIRILPGAKRPRCFVIIIDRDYPMDATKAAEISAAANDSLGGGAPPVLVAPHGVNLEEIADPKKPPDWWSKK